MKQLTTFTFKPESQREGKPEIEFQLRPIDQRTYMFMKSDILRKRKGFVMGPDGVLEAFDFSVVGWTCSDIEYSEFAKRQARTVASPIWEEWQQEIANELFKRATLGEPEAKNS